MLRDELQALGDVTIATGDITSPRAHKHTAHPLAKHRAAMRNAGHPTDPGWADRAWEKLVRDHLLPHLEADVELETAAHNPTYARYVDGLTNNTDNLPWRSITIPADHVADTCLQTPASEEPQARGREDARQSIHLHGSGALKGRDATVHLHGGDTIHGLIIGADDGDLTVLCPEETLTHVPRSGYTHVSTVQLTRHEIEAYRHQA